MYGSVAKANIEDEVNRALVSGREKRAEEDGEKASDTCCEEEERVRMQNVWGTAKGDVGGTYESQGKGDVTTGPRESGGGEEDNAAPKKAARRTRTKGRKEEHRATRKEQGARQRGRRRKCEMPGQEARVGVPKVTGEKGKRKRGEGLGPGSGVWTGMHAKKARQARRGWGREAASYQRNRNRRRGRGEQRRSTEERDDYEGSVRGKWSGEGEGADSMGRYGRMTPRWNEWSRNEPGAEAGPEKGEGRRQEEAKRKGAESWPEREKSHSNKTAVVVGTERGHGRGRRVCV